MAAGENDGIADLLDEVERKYLSPKATPFVTKATVTGVNRHGNKTPPRQRRRPQPVEGGVSVRRTNEDKELDEIIREIINEPDDLTTHHIMERRRGMKIGTSINIPTTIPHSSGLEKRCFPLLLAGTSVSLGQSDSINNRACNQLRCTSCDFHVIHFDDHVWMSRCDYLFLRNNMPDRHKLSANLTRRKGWRAYACQCSWRSVKEVEEVRRGGGGGGGGGGRGGEETTNNDSRLLKWVCGKH